MGVFGRYERDKKKIIFHRQEQKMIDFNHIRGANLWRWCPSQNEKERELFVLNFCRNFELRLEFLLSTINSSRCGRNGFRHIFFLLFDDCIFVAHLSTMTLSMGIDKGCFFFYICHIIRWILMQSFNIHVQWWSILQSPINNNFMQTTSLGMDYSLISFAPWI